MAESLENRGKLRELIDKPQFDVSINPNMQNKMFKSGKIK